MPLFTQELKELASALNVSHLVSFAPSVSDDVRYMLPPYLSL
jgi:hypothetical protein